MSGTPVSVDDLDDDLRTMKADECRRQLKIHKQAGVKTNTTGNKALLKQLLHKARRAPQADASAATPSAATPSAATPSAATPSIAGSSTGASFQSGRVTIPAEGGRVEDLLLVFDEIHPITKSCSQALGDVKQSITVLGPGELATQLNPLLKPAERLVTAVIDIKQNLREISSSHVQNIETLAKALRGVLQRPFYVHPKLSPLFVPFDIAVSELVGEDLEQHEQTQAQEAGESQHSEISQASQTSRTAFDRARQRRYEQDVIESSPAPQQESPTTPTARRVKVEPVEEEDIKPDRLTPFPELEREVAIIQQALRGYLISWQTTFPIPAARKWPEDFDEKEMAKIRITVKKHILANEDSIDLSIPANMRDTAAVETAIEQLGEMDDFPVIDARKPNILKRVFMEQCNSLYKNRRKASRAKVTQPEAAGDEAAEAGKASTGTSQGDAPVKSKPKRDRSDVEEDNNEDDGGIDAMDEGGVMSGSPRKRHKPSTGLRTGYGHGGVECMACFLFSMECSLENTHGGSCTACDTNTTQCRIACASCTAMLNILGRGAAVATILDATCPDCEVR